MCARFFFNMPSLSDGFHGLGVSPCGFKVPPALPGMYYRLSPTTERLHWILFVRLLACLFLRHQFLNCGLDTIWGHGTACSVARKIDHSKRFQNACKPKLNSKSNMKLKYLEELVHTESSHMTSLQLGFES